MTLKEINSRLLIALTAAVQVFGFEATLTVNPPVIGLNESATVTVEVRNADNPQAPSFPDVPGLSFSGMSQSTQTRIINGEMDHSVSFSTKVYPQKTGDFLIGPIQYRIDGQTQILNGRLQVVANQEQQAQSWNDLLFARLSADGDRTYVQEPFTLTLSIYSRPEVQLAGNLDLQGLPETGFADIEWQEMPATREVVEGTVYEVRRFRARTRALASGEFNLEPVLTAQVAVQGQRRRRRSFFDDSFFDPFGSRVETRPVRLPVEPLTIAVKALPTEGRPESFSGAVGRFQMHVSADPVENVHPGDPVTLKMILTGNGNFDRVMPPALPNNAPFRLFGDAVRTEEANAVVFEQVISPKHAEVTTIPSIAFSFFDTETDSYRTLESDPIPISVTAAPNSEARVFTSEESVVMPPSDTPFATESDLQRITAELNQAWTAIRPWLWTIPAALGLWLLVFIVRRLLHLRRKDTARLRRQKAPKAARAALRDAAKARKHNDPAAFHDALWRALADYFGHRLNLPPGDVTAPVVIRTLEQADFDPEAIASLRTLFDQVEASRYGLPGGTPSAEEMKARQTTLEKLLRQSEKARL